MKTIHLSVTRSLLIAVSALTLSVCFSSCKDEPVAPRYPIVSIPPYIVNDTIQIEPRNPREVELPASVEL